MWPNLVNRLYGRTMTRNLLISFDNISNREIHSKAMSIAKQRVTSIHQFLETPWQNLRMTLIGKENKWNSSKSTLRSLEHRLIKNLHIKSIEIWDVGQMEMWVDKFFEPTSCAPLQWTTHQIFSQICQD